MRENVAANLLLLALHQVNVGQHTVGFEACSKLG